MDQENGVGTLAGRDFRRASTKSSLLFSSETLSGVGSHDQVIDRTRRFLWAIIEPCEGIDSLDGVGDDTKSEP